MPSIIFVSVLYYLCKYCFVDTVSYLDIYLTGTPMNVHQHEKKKTSPHQLPTTYFEYICGPFY